MIEWYNCKNRNPQEKLVLIYMSHFYALVKSQSTLLYTSSNRTHCSHKKQIRRASDVRSSFMYKLQMTTVIQKHFRTYFEREKLQIQRRNNLMLKNLCRSFIARNNVTRKQKAATVIQSHIRSLLATEHCVFLEALNIVNMERKQRERREARKYISSVIASKVDRINIVYNLALQNRLDEYRKCIVYIQSAIRTKIEMNNIETLYIEIREKFKLLDNLLKNDIKAAHCVLLDIININEYSNRGCYRIVLGDNIELLLQEKDPLALLIWMDMIQDIITSKYTTQGLARIVPLLISILSRSCNIDIQVTPIH